MTYYSKLKFEKAVKKKNNTKDKKNQFYICLRPNESLKIYSHE